MLKLKIVGTVAAILAFIGLLGVQALLVEHWRTAYEDRDHQMRVRQELLRLERLVTDVDKGFRGYVLMKQSVFLGPMVAAEGKIPGVLDGLGRMTESWPDVHGRILVLQDRINELLDAKRRLTLELEKGQDEAVLAYIRAGEGLALANTIELGFQDLSRRLDQREQQRDRQTEQVVEWMRWGLMATATGSLGLGIGIGRANRPSGPTGPYASPTPRRELVNQGRAPMKQDLV